MRRIRIARSAKRALAGGGEDGLDLCRIVTANLETGETVKRGCGRKGMEAFGAGWRCLYCGNYVYRSGAGLAELWSHFKTGREYWRATVVGGQEFVNGVPAPGGAEGLPSRLLDDLREIRPPKWFAYYLVCEERDFRRYLEQSA